MSTIPDLLLDGILFRFQLIIQDFRAVSVTSLDFSDCAVYCVFRSVLQVGTLEVEGSSLISLHSWFESSLSYLHSCLVFCFSPAGPQTTGLYPKHIQFSVELLGRLNLYQYIAMSQSFTLAVFGMHAPVLRVA